VDINQVPENTKSFLCVTYLIDWFGLSGEMEVYILYENNINVFISIRCFRCSIIFTQPNTDELHLDPITKKEVWEEYCQDPFVLTNDEEQPTLSYNQFLGIWPSASRKLKSVNTKMSAGNVLSVKV